MWKVKWSNSHNEPIFFVVTTKFVMQYLASLSKKLSVEESTVAGVEQQGIIIIISYET